ncbi:unnamed protein product [Ectocarpus sp. CCAP 1310/34]|nr:unnamed protein product [Ectocarpus sp. CCAP 1310/34]
MGEGTEARGVDGVRTGRVHAEALAGHGIGERYPVRSLDTASDGVANTELRLTFDVFRRYSEALSRAFRPSDSHPSWEDLRIRLGLHPLESLIMGEEFVAEVPRSSSSQLDLMALAGWSGNLFLTDRHLLLHFPKRQQARVVPLGSVQDVRGSSSRAVAKEASAAAAAAAATAAAAAAAAAAAEAASAPPTPGAPSSTAPTSSTSTSRPNGAHPNGSGEWPPTLPSAAAGGCNGGGGGGGKVERGPSGHRTPTGGGSGGFGVGVGFGGNGSGGFGGGGGARGHGGGVEEAAAAAAAAATVEDGAEVRKGERKAYRLVLTKVKMQRLVSKPEECGGTRQEWLDCLREMVEVKFK